MQTQIADWGWSIYTRLYLFITGTYEHVCMHCMTGETLFLYVASLALLLTYQDYFDGNISLSILL